MLGSERVSFDTIVASGPNSAMPHHGADDRVIEDGDLVTIDSVRTYAGSTPIAPAPTCGHGE